jgi:IS5 family transposase
MRKATEFQGRLDCQSVVNVWLNLECRDEIIPILRSLQQIYSQPALRDRILQLISLDVNPDSSADRGREGFDYWQILVLAAIRQGCACDYDKLQDLAEQHRALRQIMGIGDWDEDVSFNWRRIRDNVCLLSPETIEKISHVIVGEGHRLCPQAAEHLRGDSFVMETNIHYPTEATLISDGIHQVLKLAVRIADAANAKGWRQSKKLETKTRQITRDIQRIAARKGPRYKERLQVKYQHLIRHATKISQRARDLENKVSAGKTTEMPAPDTDRLKHFLDLTDQVLQTATRRMLHDETVPNDEKLFSIYETHTQLYKRGKAGEPIQFGRLVMVYEDAAGFIVHHHLPSRDKTDRDLVVEQTKIVVQRLDQKVKSLSFDRGFHSPEIQAELAPLVPTVCIPMPGDKQKKVQQEQSTVEFRTAHQRHSGVESAIGALQAGNGLERCFDRTERGFARCLALGVLGRNLHVLGKLLIARESAKSLSAFSRRKRAA